MKSTNARRKSVAREYDFSKGWRGKFDRPNVKLNLPVYLDDEVRAFVEKIARSGRSDVSTDGTSVLAADGKLCQEGDRLYCSV